MNTDAYATILIFGLIISAVLAAICQGLFASKRSGLLGIVLMPMSGLAGIGSWYSGMESQSISWALGYGVLALLAAVGAFRHLLRLSDSHS